jgi:UDP-N-acetylmuramyl pentapeptide synthase
LERHRPLIVAVTGSVGKTTTKEAIAAVLGHPEALAAQGVRKTLGNSNDYIGLPAAVLGLRASLTTSGRLRLLARGLVEGWRQRRSPAFPGVLVLEYATGTKRSDIPAMAKLAPPTIAVVTAIGPAHLERFGTLEAIAEHKGALVRAVPPDGLVILGADTPHSAAMKDLSAAPVRLASGRGRELSHGIARIVGRHLGVRDEVIERALAELPATSGRLALLETGRCTLIDDAYNANPLSMTLGLDTLADLAKPGQRRVAVLGSMGELGAQSETYHRQVAAHARTRADLVVAVGDMARHYAGDHWFPTAGECVASIRGLTRPDDIVLVKGSHSVGLEAVVAALERDGDSATGRARGGHG